MAILFCPFFEDRNGVTAMRTNGYFEFLTYKQPKRRARKCLSAFSRRGSTLKIKIPDTEPLVISVNQLAEKLQVSARSVWRLLSHRELIAPVRCGRTTRWELDKVEEWIAKACSSESCFEGYSQETKRL